MTEQTMTRPIAPPTRRARLSAGALQWLLAALVLAYLALGWRAAEALIMLIDMQILAPAAGLLIVSGSMFLALGAARSVYDRRKGLYCLLLAAAELALAAPQIGNWDYRVSKVLLATLLFGLASALLGAWLAHRSGKQ